MLSRRHFLTTTAAALAAPQIARAARPLNVVATTGMIADAVQAIGGSKVSLTTLMGPNVDPHGYRQTRNDIVMMTRADVVFWNGLFLEAQMEDLMPRIAQRALVVPVAEAVPEADLIAHSDYAGRKDPHVWMVPELWQNAIFAIEAGLIEASPEDRNFFRANTFAYLAEVKRVADYARDVLDRVAEPSRVLVTAHDAFGYFGRAYGYEVMGVQGISTESEAGLDRIRALTQTIVDRNIRAVFVESSVTDRNLRALIEGAASLGHEVDIGGELFSDAMGEPGTYEATYVGMIDHNATVIASALGAQVPERGMNGRLFAGI